VLTLCVGKQVPYIFQFIFVYATSSIHYGLCSMDTPIMEPCCVRNMSDKRVMCFLNNYHVSACHVHFNVAMSVQHSCLVLTKHRHRTIAKKSHFCRKETLPTSCYVEYGLRILPTRVQYSLMDCGSRGSPA